jgi:hypothetical protein
VSAAGGAAAPEEDPTPRPARTLALLAVLLAAAATLASAAPRARAANDAAQPCAGAQSTPAQLVAAGNGTIVLDGKVVVFGVIRSGTGLLYVEDRVGDAQVTVKGKRQQLPDQGELRVHPRRDRFYVTGSCVTVRIRGRRIVIAAGVSGEASVRGVGAYTVNAGPGKRWTRSMAAVALAAPVR